MPYVLVETCDAVGNKELLAAPETWIQRHDDGTDYLCWPNIRNTNMLNELLSDEHSTPLASWETHECVIKCANIQSLSIAAKMIKTLQNHWKTTRKRTIEANDDGTTGPACKISRCNVSGKKPPIQTISQNVHTEELEPDEAQLIGLFNELRSLIESRHDEARKKLHDGFYRIEKCLHSIGSDSLSIEQEAMPDNSPQCSQSVKTVEFYVNPITCIEEMVDFEERLNDEEYQTQVEHWIDCTIGYETYPENRMRGILGSLFENRFLTNFSWTGSGTGKLSFMAYENIVNLFVYAGTTDVNIATPRYVAQFFIKILQQVTTQVVRNHLTPNRVDSQASLNGENNSELQTVENLCETTSTDGDDSQPSFNQSNTEFSVDPLTCIEGLDAFEAKLDDAEFRAQMHKWINEHVAYVMNPETRMIEILYLLFDRDFLSNFTWIGARKGSYRMKAYNNVILLFQYVGTTAAHRADYIFVENFFNKKLRYVGR